MTRSASSITEGLALPTPFDGTSRNSMIDFSNLYVSPSGTPAGRGTPSSPMDLSTALIHHPDDGTVAFMDGIYEVSGEFSDLEVSGTFLAHTGSRPIVTRSDGSPPSISIQSGAVVRGMWFGGIRPESDDGARTITVGSGCTVEDCTLFGYIDGIQNGADAHGNVYSRNRFVNCGYQLRWHPIYIANLNSAGPEDGCLVEECIFVGCEGYSVHLYHQPSYGLAQYNLIGRALYGLALQGDQQGPVSGNRNIIWGVTNTPLYNSTTLGTCDHNVWQGCSKPNAPDDHNYFVSPVPTAGTNPVVWQEADVVANLGASSAAIDAAIAALITKFGQTTQQIHDDATIEAEFAVLKSVIDTWKLVP